MKFNKRNLPKTSNHLDDFVRQNGLIPIGKAERKGVDIYLAEGDLPDGGWQVVWIVKGRDEKMLGGSWVDFEATHDIGQGWTAETKRQARVNTALVQANWFVDKALEVGLYDA